MKILNLYACLGGNRYKWNEVKNDIEVTAVELDKELARLYQERFPNDKVIVTDAHQYLLDHYEEFDFIWSSPPCPSHSKARFARHKSTKLMYPDMSLYQQIIFLKHYYKGKYCVENVIPYYDCLIPGKQRGRHIYWTNFRLPNILSTRKKLSAREFCVGGKSLQNFHKINLDTYKGKQRKDKIARNLVDYEAGKTILQTLLDIKQNKVNQIGLFNIN
jgi:DNA (cytosine-5)-methyltransferase 1|tara:strand:+ start:2340 stop:2990 length:651 start_codon:yes stop_codon:yes gene_type:complete